MFSIQSKTFPTLILGVTLLLGLSPEAWAQTGEKCTPERTLAENNYLEGKFDEAVAALQVCLDREELSIEEAVKVYRLLGLVYLNSGDTDNAQQTMRELLAIDPSYQADAVQDPPSYAAMVDAVREEMAAAAPVEEEPADPVTEVPEEEAPVVTDQPQVDPSVLGPEVTPPSDQPAMTPIITPSQRKRLLQTPRSWLVATGGALVLGAAVAIALGGSKESFPAPPR